MRGHAGMTDRVDPMVNHMQPSTLDAPVDRPEILETTALGAAWLAGSRAGVWPKAADFARSWALEHRFKPRMNEKTRAAKLKGWRDAVRRTLSA